MNTMKVTITAVQQDRLNAIRLEMISAYFREAFRAGYYRTKRSPDGMVTSLDMTELSNIEAQTVSKLIPQIWPGVTWDIKVTDHTRR